MRPPALHELALGAAMLLASACTPAPDHPATCDTPQLRATADWLITEFPPDWGWGWRAGIVVSGLTAAYECTGDERYLETAETWLQREIDIAFAPRHLNDVAPGLALLDAWAATGDALYMDAALSLGDFMVDEWPAIDGAYVHADDRLWLDTTYMTAPFLVELGRMTGDERYTDAGVTQVLEHAARMQDADGLWWHGWDYSDAVAGLDPLHGVHWGRGNGFAAAAAAGVILRLAADDPRRAAVVEVLGRTLAGVGPLQHESGGWHTILDDPTTMLETSATVLLTTAARAGESLGLDTADMRERGEPFIELARATGNGYLAGASGPTSLSDDPSSYTSVAADAPTYFTEGLYLMYLAMPAWVGP